MNKTNNLRAYLRDLYEGIVSKKPDASRNPQNFRSEIEAIRTGGELYEVMDASELPEDAPNGSLALVEGEPIPEAYTVSSVDELPTNAVEGSMAIVESDDILGGWLLNNTINLYEFDWYFNFKVKSPNGEFEEFTNLYADDTYLYYSSDENELAMYSNQGLPYGSATYNWTNYIVRVLTITEIDDAEAEAWVRANARKLSSLYTHENGEWAYKCEVA